MKDSRALTRMGTTAPRLVETRFNEPTRHGRQTEGLFWDNQAIVRPFKPGANG